MTKPLLIYDGTCGFCRRHVERWRRITGERVEYATSAEAAGRAGVPRDRLDEAVALVTPGGVLYGAEAVFAALAEAPAHRWKLWCYRNVPGFGGAAERVYRFVARHRGGISKASALLSGRDPSPSTYVIAQWLFVRLVGAVFFIAFWSLWVQVHGLVGESGILPAGEFLDWAQQARGGRAVLAFPTLCWIDAGDDSLAAQCALGTLMSMLVVAGLAPRLCLGLAWALYLSVSVAGQVFLSFQWDTLLLETGFVALFIAPGGARPSLAGPGPTASGLWLGRLLLFKLMFLSGVTKLLSGDPTWRDLTALAYHYETQPLPTWIGWWAHQLPGWFQALSAAGMFAVELGLPWLIFAPRRLRHLAAAGFASFMLFIGLTGNYNFFGLLAVALGVLLLDDRLLRRAMPARIGRRFEVRPRPVAHPVRRYAAAAATALVVLTSGLVFLREMVLTVRRDAVPAWLAGSFDACDRYVFEAAGGNLLLHVTDPFRTINGYGLFRVMTTKRPEIVIEGSRDGYVWLPYEFRWKAGDVERRPRFVEPHQPRLDWQMWFAALDPYRNMSWLHALELRLLEGSPAVLDLLGEDPFAGEPPRYVRLVYYEYRFTDRARRAATGAWWDRRRVGLLTGPLERIDDRGR